jgi:hypothetical protein
LGLFVTPETAENYDVTKIDVSCKPYDIALDVKAYPKIKMISAVELNAAHTDFGGFSGMALKRDGSKIYAITDRARLAEADPVADPQGGISCWRSVSLRPLRGTSGDPLAGSYLDAEGMTFSNSEQTKALISFERRHRAVEYDLTEEKATPLRELKQPDIADELTYNESYETVRRLKNGDIILFPEYLPEKGAPSRLRGYVLNRKTDQWKQIRIMQTEVGRYVTDLIELKNGDILTLERAFTVLTGPTAIIRHFSRAEFMSGVPQKGEILASFNRQTGSDNFEAMASLPIADGELIYLLSDDNFLSLQKTLLVTLKIPD